MGEAFNLVEPRYTLYEAFSNSVANIRQLTITLLGLVLIARTPLFKSSICRCAEACRLMRQNIKAQIFNA